jgi:hypothetical protein
MCEACSPKDRRDRRVTPVTALPSAALAMTGDLAEATRAKLAELGRTESPEGVAAVMAAAQLDSGRLTGSQYASLLKAWLQTLEAATKGVTSGSSSLDELRKRREQRRRGA